MAINLLSSLDPLLKDQYSPFLDRQINTADPILSLYEDGQGSGTWDGTGRRFLVGQVLTYAQSAMSISENADLPEGGIPVTGTLDVRMKFTAAALALTAQSMKLSEGSNASYISELQLQMESVTECLRRDTARIAYGDGRGALAQVNGAAALAATTVNLDNPGLRVGAVGGARYIVPGMRLAFVNPGDTAIEAVAEVATVSPTGTSITLTAGLTAAVSDNAIVYIAQDTTNVSFATGLNRNNDPMGLDGMINDEVATPTYFGLSRTTYPNLSSKVINVAGVLSEDILHQAFDFAQMRGDTQDLNASSHVIICDPSVRRAYLALTYALRRYISGDIQNPNAGTRAITGGTVSVGDVPIMVSRNAPYGEMVILNKEGMERVNSTKGFAEETGSMWKQITVSGKRRDAYVADWRGWYNCYHRFPRKSVRLKNISTVSVFYQAF